MQIDCSEWTRGKVFFANAQKRIGELLSALDEVLSSGLLSKQDALVLRGRMQFAKAQIWGRTARLCLDAVTRHAYDDSGTAVSDHLRESLLRFKKFLSQARPRELSRALESPMFLFTDASFSPAESSWPCGLGGVLVDGFGRVVSAFSFCLSMADLNALGYPQKSTVIFEAELLALLVSFL